MIKVFANARRGEGFSLARISVIHLGRNARGDPGGRQYFFGVG